MSRLARVIVVAVALGFAPAVALAQMPDLRQMSGQPLPSTDLPAGTVTIRVVRQSLGNNVSDHEVVLAGGAVPLRARTDVSGRAVFTGVTAGPSYRARTVVDGEQLESQPFALPPTSGVRVLLAAGLGSAPPSGNATPTPAPAGSVAFGGQSRLVVDIADELVEVFGLFDIVNAAAAPATLAAPIVFELPEDAVGASTMEGSSPLAKVEGRRVIVAGPLPSGTTEVQFGYRLPQKGATLSLQQPLPLTLPQGTVIVRKLDGLSVTIPGERIRRDVPLEGRIYTVVTADSIPAGGAIQVGLNGLPARPQWPRTLALALAAGIVLWGVWLVRRSTDGVRQTEIARLRDARVKVFNELLSLERRHRGKTNVDEAVRTRRAALVESIVELDEALEAELAREAPPHGPAASSVRERTPAVQ